MTRETDLRSSLSWMVQVMVVGFSVIGCVWIQVGIRKLRDASARRESELVQFVHLSQDACRVRPSKDLAQAAKKLGDRIAQQAWHASLRTVRPSVIVTAAGLTVRFTPTTRPAAAPGGGR